MRLKQVGKSSRGCSRCIRICSQSITKLGGQNVPGGCRQDTVIEDAVVEEMKLLKIENEEYICPRSRKRIGNNGTKIGGQDVPRGCC